MQNAQRNANIQILLIVFTHLFALHPVLPPFPDVGIDCKDDRVAKALCWEDEGIPGT